MSFHEDSDQCKEEFIKTGMWPNEVMYQLWRRAWAAALAANGSAGNAGVRENGNG